MANAINSNEDVIARFEELETELQEACEQQSENNVFETWIVDMAGDNEGVYQDAAQEFTELQKLFRRLKR